MTNLKRIGIFLKIFCKKLIVGLTIFGVLSATGISLAWGFVSLISYWVTQYGPGVAALFGCFVLMTFVIVGISIIHALDAMPLHEENK
jgi:hypothetical protein